jgi:hypothetical protein
MWTRILSFLIVSFWLLMMLSLVKDKILPQRQALKTTRVDLAELVQEWEDTDDWFVVSNLGRSIGAMRLAIEETDRPIGFKATFNFVINLKILQKELRIFARGFVQLTNNFELDYFGVEFEAWDLEMILRGRVMGDDLMQDLRLLLEVTTMQLATRERAAMGEAVPDANVSRYVLPLERQISFLEAARPVALRELDLQPGQSYQLDVFDPIFQMKRGDYTLTVDGIDFLSTDDPNNPQKVTRVITQFGSAETLLWLDDDRRVVRRQLMPKREMYLDRITPEELAEKHKKYQQYIEFTLQAEPLDPALFDDIEPSETSEFQQEQLLTGIFKSLSIVPEFEQ